MMKRLVEIDTSQPFGSVEEAVSRFGGRRTSFPRRLLSPDVDPKDLGTLYVDKMEDHTAQLERVLITRERETLEVLKELEETKKLLQGLKVSPLQEGPSGSFISAQNRKSPPSMGLDSAPPLMDLDQAKVSLKKTSIDLAVIRASVESLNKKMSEEMEVPNEKDVFFTDDDQESPWQREVFTSRSDQYFQFSFEAEQFKKMVETSRYEVMQAMSEIEKTKVSIKMAEMRLDAARKIEEAAKAVEAIAFAERKSNSHKQLQPDEITPASFKMYNSHFRKAKEVEEICKMKFIDGNGMHQMEREMHYSEAVSRKLKQTTRATYRNDEDIDVGFLGRKSNFHDIHPSDSRKDRSLLHPVEEQIDPGSRSTTSIGDILSRKLVLQEDFRAERKVEAEEATLSQMIREQSGLIFRHVKSMKDGRKVRHFFAEKKKFGFIHVVLPKNRNKKNRSCT